MTAIFVWRDRSGEPISCLEKLRLLDENAQELAQTLRDAWDDAVLMGVDPQMMRDYLDALVKDVSERPSA